MNDDTRIDLYTLLPAVYRLRDADQGYPLRAVLDLLTQQANLVKENIDGLWDDLFIETCEPWVIPYIGDLVGNTPLHEGVLRRRADVAKTIYYRRRKGTLPQLEELARDVTGWSAVAVVFFELLLWRQNLNHLRFDIADDPRRGPLRVDRVGPVNLRSLDLLDRLNGPFDRLSHTVDVRPIRNDAGRHNIRKIGFFLWRLQSYRLTDIAPRPAAGIDYGFLFSTLGHSMPLFTQPAREADEAGLAGEVHVRGPLRPLAVHYDLEDARAAVAQSLTPASDYVGLTRSLHIDVVSEGTDPGTGDPVLIREAVPPEAIIAVDLAAWKQPEGLTFTRMQPDGTIITRNIQVGVDVQKGRFVLTKEKQAELTPDQWLEVAYNYGFNAKVGGGPYDRRATLAPRDGAPWVAVVKQQIPAPPGAHATLENALAAWRAAGPPEHAVIEVQDNGTYEENALAIDLSHAKTLTIEARDGLRPTIRPAGGPGIIVVESGTPSQAVLTLNGLLIEGGLCVHQDSLADLRLVHCTLVPGLALEEDGTARYPDWPSLEVKEPPDASTIELVVEIDHSILGWLLLPAEDVRLIVQDSILDAMPEQSAAHHTEALVSGTISPFVPLTSTVPRVLVTIGDEGPFLAEFPAPGSPVDLPGKARNRLQRAIQGAHPSPAFRDARVLTSQGSHTLIILPGTPAPVTIAPAPKDGAPGDDPTATQLKLTAPEASLHPALIGGPLPPTFALRAERPQMEASDGTTTATVHLRILTPTNDRRATTPAQACNQLRRALRRADLEGDGPATSAWVQLADYGQGRSLVVVSRTSDPITFGPTLEDLTTLRQLGLVSDRRPCAIGDGRDTGYGPHVTLRRVTVFGEARVRICYLASEVIFTEALLAERRQVGCVRFSYVPLPASQTPRRYRSQADLALAQRRADLVEAGQLAPDADLPMAERDRVLKRLRPRFTSERYGEPGYAQLSLLCDQTLRTGAEDGSEMGVFSSLKQPQREANLRIRLDEYLPVGLEAGLIYVT